MPSTERDPIHVVAGVLRNGRGDVLIARRPEHVHQGGLWEFPGGKSEPGEQPGDVLRRELAEELGVEVLEARPLITVEHDYGDRLVILDVWQVLGWRGRVHGREGQTIEWVPPARLGERQFPPADEPVISAILEM